jgi:hypothetical protein
MRRASWAAKIPLMRTHEFWRDGETGEMWAVELGDGIVTGCAGPLHRSEVDPSFLERYTYESRHAASIEAARDRFEPLDEQSLFLLGGD